MMKSIPSTHSLEWKKILEIDDHIYDSTIGKKSRFSLVLSAFQQIFFSRPNIPLERMSTDFLFVKTMKRHDYDELFKTIANQCPSTRHCLDVEFHHSPHMRAYPLKTVFRHRKTITALIKRNLLKSAYLTARAVRYLEVLDRIQMQYEYETVVAFADMQPIENLIIQYANLLGKKTATMQHGLYIDYSEFPNINTVNYRSAVAQYFLAWGADTQRLIEKHHPDVRFFICGKPIFPKGSQSKKTDYFSLLFDQNLLANYNRTMLGIAYDVAEKTGLKVNVRLHPRNNIAQYRFRKSLTHFNLAIEGSHFIIGHTTSMIHELMRADIAVYKYFSSIPAIPVPDSLCFTSASDLLAKINASDQKLGAFNSIAEEYIKYIGKESLDSYRSAFLEISRASS